MDGYLKIKTKIDNKDVDKGIVELENKIKKLQEDNSKASTEQSSLQREIDSYEQLQQKADAYRHKIKELQAEKDTIFKSNPTLAFQGNMPEYENIKVKIGEIQQKYAQAVSEIDKQSPKIEKVRTKLDKVKSKQTENNTKIEQFKQKIEKINLNKVQQGVDTVGQKIQNSISKLGKMAMAVFGIRTAFNAVRQAMNAVSQYNPQISTDLEYMRYCIANMLTPVIQKLVQLLYTALSYINAIANAWFGINLFGNSSVKNFQKMQKSASGTAKSAKEIQKSLQGFDEMNIIQEDGSTSGNTGTGISAPSTDLSNMQGEVPKWLKWIMDNKDLILGTLGAIAGIIGAIKIAHFISEIAGLNGGILKLVSNLGLLKSLGIALIITGVILLIKDVVAMIQNPCWENFGKILVDIGIILAGIALVTMNWIVAIGALVAIIAGVCIQLFAQKGAILSVEDAQKNLEEATKNLEEANNNYINSVDRAEDAQKKLEEAQNKTGLSGKELFEQVQNGTLDYAHMTAEQKEVYKAYLDNEKAQNELEESTIKLKEAKQKEKIASWENKLATMAEAGQYDEYKKAVVEAFKNGKLSADEARDLIGKSMSEMSRDSQQTFMEDLPSDIKNGLDPKNYETTGQKIGKWFQGVWQGICNVFSHVDTWFRETFTKAWQAVKNVFSTGGKIFDGIKNGILNGLKTVINAIIGGINKVIATPFNGLNSALTKIRSFEILGNKPFSWINTIRIPQIPRLAKGGVISQPTTAIIGEAGKEAVVPLENNLEWLDILATKIANKIDTGGGSYIINMDSRTIQRGIAKRQQELAFAKNGR